MIRTILAKKAIIPVIALVGGLGMTGCDWLGGLPANAHLGNNGVAYVSLSHYANQVDVTLVNGVSSYIVQTGTNCNWNNACMVQTASQFFTNGQQLGAINDCGIQEGIGQVCPWYDLKNAAIIFAFGGDGPSYNCLGTRFTFEGEWIPPTNPIIGGVTSEAAWYTVWPWNPTGYQGDGAAVC